MERKEKSDDLREEMWNAYESSEEYIGRWYVWEEEERKRLE